MAMIVRPCDLLPDCDWRGAEKLWGRVIRSRAEVNLEGKGGWALCGAWVKWLHHVAISEGEWIVVKYENDTCIKYALATVRRGKLEMIYQTGQKNALRMPQGMQEQQIADSLNYILKRFALHIWGAYLRGLRLTAKEIREAVEALKTLTIGIPKDRGNSGIATMIRQLVGAPSYYRGGPEPPWWSHRAEGWS